MEMKGIYLLPAGILGFALGAAFAGPSRRGLSMLPQAPLKDVPFAAWERFVSVMVIAPKGHVSPKNRLGAFQMDPRRLKDIGAIDEVRKNQVGSYEGKWSSGLTASAFLGSMPLQYATFVRSVRAMAPKVSGLVGSEVDGKKASLSGLLGVGHMAGEVGAASWIKSADERRRFGRTTEMFDRTNGIF